jgi:hypothetical protein
MARPENFLPYLSTVPILNDGKKCRDLVRAKKTGRREGRWGRFPAGEGEENRVIEFSLFSQILKALYNIFLP